MSALGACDPDIYRELRTLVRDMYELNALHLLCILFYFLCSTCIILLLLLLLLFIIRNYCYDFISFIICYLLLY